MNGWLCVFEEIDSVDERALSDSNNEIDGIEVSIAAEASSEIGSRIYGSVEFIADGAKEPEEGVAIIVRQL